MSPALKPQGQVAGLPANLFAEKDASLQLSKGILPAGEGQQAGIGL